MLKVNSLLDSYYKFALKVDVTEYFLNSITGGDSVLLPNETICHLKTLVSVKMENYSSWLLIYDNFNDIWSSKDWVGLGDHLPDEYWGGCGHVLVTTQDSTNLLLVRECSLKMPGFYFERFASFPVIVKK